MLKLLSTATIVTCASPSTTQPIIHNSQNILVLLIWQDYDISSLSRQLRIPGRYYRHSFRSTDSTRNSTLLFLNTEINSMSDMEYHDTFLLSSAYTDQM
ncbi:hypothetical protein FPV67DRAFT_1494957, partial [Lyophyllum atratum]